MRVLATVLAMIASPLPSETVLVQVVDGNPFDRLIIYNTACPLYDTVFRLDLATSQAGVIFDTLRGGPGSRDPMPIELREGDAVLGPVADGAQTLDIFVHKLPTYGAITVTMDIDDVQTGTEEQRVVVQGADVAGATITLTSDDTKVTAALGADGRVAMTVPDTLNACLIS